MRCEEARNLLPAYVDGDPHSVGELDLHLTTCAACRDELAAHRQLLEDLPRLRDAGPEPSDALLRASLALIPAPSVAVRLLGSVQAHPVAYAVASLGGVAVGATAVALARRRDRASAGVS